MIKKNDNDDKKGNGHAMMKLMASDNDVLERLSAPKQLLMTTMLLRRGRRRRSSRTMQYDEVGDVLVSLSAPKQLHQTLPGCNSSGCFQKVTEEYTIGVFMSVE